LDETANEGVMVAVTDLDEFASDAAFALVDGASDAAFAIDRNLTIIGWNRAARDYLGYAPHEVLGQHCSDVLQAVYAHGEPLCVPSCEAVRCFRRSQHFVAPACYARHKDGGWVPLNLTSVVMSRPVREIDASSVLAVVFLRGEGENQDLQPTARTLQVFTFGRFGLAAGGSSLAVEKWERRQSLTLLKILIAHLGRAVHREVLIEHLWPEADERNGRDRLKVTVYALRQQLRAAGMGEDVVETAGEAYVLSRQAVWVDVEAFEKCIADGSARQRLGQWREALQCYGEAQRLYRGEYMAEDIHADWCAEERDRLHEIHLEMMAGMAECHAECGRYTEAVSVCRSILVDDPCREGIHRLLMEYLARLGHTDAVVAQYRQCQRVLARELGVEPMPETRSLYRKILAGEERAASGKAEPSDKLESSSQADIGCV
jgi:PAS domain S-box-containing protein